MQGCGSWIYLPGVKAELLIKDIFYFSKFHKPYFPPFPLANLFPPVFPRMQIAFSQA
jgi:hypothetical protein